MKILFVCTGNTCRSPMAEAIFNKINTSVEHTAASRGTNVFFPQNISPKAKNALEAMGINSFVHKSQQITEDDIKESDLILTMTSSHKMALKTACPKYKQKVFTLNEKAFGKDYDISDPYGLTQEDYDICAKQILDAVEKIICTL